MTAGLVPPEVAREMSDLKKRVSDLERQLGEVLRGALDHGLPFNLAGPLEVTESVPWTPRFLTRAVDVVALLGVAGSTATSFEVRKNGSPVATITLEAGEVFRRSTISVPLTADTDLLTVAITVVGTDAEDLDVIVRFR